MRTTVVGSPSEEFSTDGEDFCFLASRACGWPWKPCRFLRRPSDLDSNKLALLVEQGDRQASEAGQCETARAVT